VASVAVDRRNRGVLARCDNGDDVVGFDVSRRP
jgi:hypothetical protein